MATPFDDWLRQLRAAQKGPVSINIDRGVPYAWSFAIAGDWTGSAVSASLRLYPDAAGATVEDFTVAGPAIEGGWSTFTLSLTDMQTGALPAAPAGEGLATLAFDVLLDPGSGIERRIFGGCATITGKVTDGS